jgi:hypothetical protein
MTPQQRQKQLERIRKSSAWGAAFIILTLGVVFAILCFRLAPTPDDASLNLALMGASIVVGWLAGTLASPGTLREEGRFGTTAKAISTFISGYLLAKIDNVMNALLAPRTLLESASLLPAFRLAMTLAVTIGTALGIYICRVYILDWVPDAKSSNDLEDATPAPPHAPKPRASSGAETSGH